MAAFPLLAATLTDNPTLIALVFAAGEAPRVVFGFWAGSIADGVDRRRLINRVTLVRTLLLFALAGLVITGSASYWPVALAAFVLGAAEVLADTTTGTLLPLLVAPNQLERANSRMVAAPITGNELVGPALGGLLFAIGAAVPFFTNGSLLAMALVLVAGLPMLQPTGAESGADRDQPRVLTGIPHVRATPILRAVTWTSALLAGVDAAWFALLVLFVRDELEYGPAGFGLLLAVGSVGGLGGAALADRRPNRPLTAVTGAVFVSTAISLVALGAVPTVAVTTLVLVTTSAAFSVWNVHGLSARQRVTPNHLLGRVGGTYRTVIALASTVGALTGGFLVNLTSMRSALAGYGLILLVAAPFAVATVREAAATKPEPPGTVGDA